MNDEGSAVGWGFLSFFIPIVGLVLFLVWKDEKPHTAKVCGICALVSFCTEILFGILLSTVLAGMIASIVEQTYMITFAF